MRKSPLPPTDRRPLPVSRRWPEDGAAMTGPWPAIKIREGAPHPSKPDIFTQLREGRIGTFYQNWLKPIPLIRKLIVGIFHHIFPVYVRHIANRSSMARRWRPIVKLVDYVKTTNVAPIKLVNVTKVDTPPPKVLPIEDRAFLVTPHNHYEFPSVYVAPLSNVEVYGGTNLIFVQDAVICHDLYDFERDYTSEELHGRHVIDAKKMRMRLIANDSAPMQIPIASAFLDACALNYAHWVTEVLPRISVFCSQKDFNTVPLIINNGLHKNLLESLSAIIGDKRDIYLLPIGRAIKVDTLYVVSSCGYVPFDFRNKISTPPAQGLFCPTVLTMMSQAVSAVLQRSTNWPQKIYLRRNSVGKIATNLPAVEKLLLDEGFFFVEPEKLSFAEQVMLFKNAKLIVGSSGAALANLIFCPVDARVVILIGKSARVSYWYWQNLARAVNRSICYVLGEVPDIDKKNNQPNFTVPLDALMRAVSEEGGQ
jgi:capsular polysaccharide biosynthesis protein